MGGHATAAVVGNNLIELGWDDAFTLALTAATFGIFASVLGGLAIINIGARFGYIKNITRFEDMEIQFRKGLIPKEERVSIGANNH
jgi:ESS family glutamate:Na+ symporter